MDVPRTRYVRSGDAYIAYQVSGGGRLDVLLVPHFFNHLELWWESRHHTAFARTVSEFARLIRFDKRGTGMSDRTGGVPPFDVQLDDVRAVLDAAGSERAVVWAGGDATPMILLFTATYPERVRGLVLWNPQPTYIRNPEMPWLVAPEEFRRQIEETGGGIEDPDGLFEAIDSDGLTREEVREYWRVCRLATSPGDQIAFATVLGQTDVRHVLPAIRVPTLVVTNDATPAAASTARYVAERIPTARLAVVAGPARPMMLGDGASLFDEVREFVHEVEALPADEPERVLATILFTDIVDSTAKAVDVGDAAWRTLLAAHHTRVRRELARYRGRELDTAGDGFFATFDGPARAIRCACAIRASVRELGLEIRAGLHTGECELLDAKVAGIAVSVGARVASRARAGEVLVSSTVKDLVAGSGIAFSDRGAAELKGIPGQWSLYAVESA